MLLISVEINPEDGKLAHFMDEDIDYIVHENGLVMGHYNSIG